MVPRNDAKKAIVDATIELIQESGGNIEELTVRTIAERSNVGIGLINYHFQTKENLIEVSVQQIIGEVISKFKPDMNGNLNRIEQLKNVVKSVADFLAGNPSVARISILGDFKTPKTFDNTMQTVKGFGLSLKDVNFPDKDKTLLMFMITSVLQTVFLRRELSEELFGYHFDDKVQRDRFIDVIMDYIKWEGTDPNE
ncbi:TetR family transcriptional regulator [Paenibacillus antibioticophila]|uniref:TetR family transcriptional regulator n=1 Tax=Paenibacillus antibioticophila TaxID=1274374 RepID=A0A919XSN0_9BACL|nr:TetR/AcrR family transcriptional regulator [Paenibacillus antibioticophila]GIO37244.1 TetR family transcriptional regulator [Paenibacillus antibioticophila]